MHVLQYLRRMVVALHMLPSQALWDKHMGLLDLMPPRSGTCVQACSTLSLLATKPRSVPCAQTGCFGFPRKSVADCALREAASTHCWPVLITKCS